MLRTGTARSRTICWKIW